MPSACRAAGRLSCRPDGSSAASDEDYSDRHPRRGTWALIATLARPASIPSCLAAVRDRVAGPPASHRRPDKERSDSERGQRPGSAVASSTDGETSAGSPSARNTRRCTRHPEPAHRVHRYLAEYLAVILRQCFISNSHGQVSGDETRTMYRVYYI